jgi:RNA polymerase sigma-70 factor (ECF subfamily)
LSVSKEEHIIERIKSGDNEVLSNIYEEHREEFFIWLNKYFNCSADEAKDTYQNAILVFYENIISGKLKEMTSSVKTYLFAVGKYKMMEQKKLSYKFSSDEQLPNLSEKETNLEALNRKEEDLQMVEHCLHLLGDPCKTLLELYYYKRLSMAEITEAMDYKNVDTTKNLKYKCIKRLRKLFEEQ